MCIFISFMPAVLYLIYIFVLRISRWMPTRQSGTQTRRSSHISHLTNTLRMDSLCQNIVNKRLITQWNFVSLVRECATWWSERWRAIFIKLLTLWRKSAGLCFFFSLVLKKSPLLSFSSQTRAEETLTALSSSIVATFKLSYFLSAVVRWCGVCRDWWTSLDINCVTTIYTTHQQHRRKDAGMDV